MNQNRLQTNEKLTNISNKDKQFVSIGLAMQKQLTLTTNRVKGSAYLNVVLFDRYQPILKRKLRLRLLILGGVAVMFVLSGLFGQTNLLEQKDLITLLPFLFFCDVFFFIYYMLQPFTDGMQVVSPLYRIVSAVLYWVSYADTQLYIVACLCCSCFTGSLGLCGHRLLGDPKKAPKTFRIKLSILWRMVSGTIIRLGIGSYYWVREKRGNK